MSNMTETEKRVFYQRATVTLSRVRCPEPYGRVCSTPGAVVPVLRHLIGGRDREHFAVISLDRKNQIIAVEVAHIGETGQCAINPACVFRTSIISGAEAIILAHNHPAPHPDGPPHPSAEDILITERLQQAGALFGIQIHDHIILGGAYDGETIPYMSFAEEGLLVSI